MASGAEAKAENSNCLFPFLSQSQNKQTLPTLFPAYREFKAEGGSESTSQDWLKNESFKTQHADVVHSHQQDVCPTKTKKSLTTVNPDSQLYHSSDEASEEESWSHSHKEKKQKKEKRKKHKDKEGRHHKKRQKADDVNRADSTEAHTRHDVSDTMLVDSKKVFIEQLHSVTPEHAFYLDRKADKNNYVYQSIYKMHIARHHRMANHCLGNDSRVFVTLGKGGVNRKPSAQGDRYFWTSAKSKTKGEDDDDNDEGLVIVEYKPQSTTLGNFTGSNTSYLDDSDYIPLLEKDTQESELSVDITEGGIYDRATAMYVQGKGILLNTGERGGHSSQSGLQRDYPKPESHHDGIKRRTAAFNKQLAEDFQNIQLWLEFIRFQDDTIEGNDSVSRDKSQHDKKVKQKVILRDIKVAIFDKALEKNPNSIPLKIAKLEFCGDFWEKDKLLSEWKQLVFVHAADPAVWKQYLSFVESKFGVFSVSGIKQAYGKCLTMLRGIRDGVIASHKPKKDTTAHMMDIFVQLCNRLWQAGHCEMTVALLQAQLEYNLFYPDVLRGASREDQLDFFASFWESKAGHVGDTGATGWTAWVASKGEVPAVQPLLSRDDTETAEESLLDEHKERHGAWLALERSRSGHHWLPWRPDAEAGEDEDDCEDPERIVGAEDLTEYLFLLDTDQQRFHLLCRALELLGVPFDPCFETSRLQQEQYWTLTLQGCGQLFGRSVEGPILTKSADEGIEFAAKDHFVANLFRQTLPVLSDIHATVLILAYMQYMWSTFMAKRNSSSKSERKARRKQLRQTLKGLLAEDRIRGNWLAWERFAVISWRLGEAAEARKVLNMTLGSIGEAVTDMKERHRQTVTCKLHSTYACMEMGLVPGPGAGAEAGGNGSESCGIPFMAESHSASPEGKSWRALAVLVSLCEGQFTAPPEEGQSWDNTPPTKLLHCKRIFAARAGEAVAKEVQSVVEVTEDDLLRLAVEGSLSVHWTVCHALFCYITSGVDSAVDILTNSIGALPTSPTKDDQDDLHQSPKQAALGIIRAQLTEAHVALMAVHVATARAPLRLLRQPLQDALRLSPENSALLQRCVDLELGSSVSGGLRRFLMGLCRRTRSPILWLYAVQAEARRMEKLRQGAALAASLCHIPEFTTALPDTGITHQIRAWLEKALSVPTSQQCILLWRLYLHLEINQKHWKQAEAVFYRSLQICPWAKVLYIDFLEAFPVKLREVTDLLQEKELRMRTPLEELDLLLASKVEPAEEGAWEGSEDERCTEDGRDGEGSADERGRDGSEDKRDKEGSADERGRDGSEHKRDREGSADERGRDGSEDKRDREGSVDERGRDGSEIGRGAQTSEVDTVARTSEIGRGARTSEVETVARTSEIGRGARTSEVETVARYGGERGRARQRRRDGREDD